MSGHSKWSTIKRKKGANDAARGKVFSKISKEIMVAVREAGADPNTNHRLRSAIIKARTENMPNDNIDRAIKKGSGGQDGVNFEEIQYEGYGPGGVAILVSCLTDNKNRTGSEVRSTFTKKGGNLGEAGSVSYLFSRKGIIIVDKNAVDEDTLFSLALESGAEDISNNDTDIEILSPPEDFNTVIEALSNAKIVPVNAEIILLPSSYISQSKEIQEKILNLVGILEDLDDVQVVSHNLEIQEEN